MFPFRLMSHLFALWINDRYDPNNNYFFHDENRTSVIQQLKFLDPKLLVGIGFAII